MDVEGMSETSVEAENWSLSRCFDIVEASARKKVVSDLAYAASCVLVPEIKRLQAENAELRKHKDFTNE